MDREVVLRDRTAVIRDGRVVEVAASGDVEPPEDVTAIDARGLYLVPGLIDAHVHLRAGDMDAYLAAGVTTVRNMWGTPEVAELRRQVEERDRPGALAEELLELQRAGLTAYEAVRTATTGAADFLGLAHEIGTVAEGMRADLVLLRDDPLAELDALSLPVAVVAGGEWLGSDRLRAAAVIRSEDGGEDR